MSDCLIYKINQIKLTWCLSIPLGSWKNLISTSIEFQLQTTEVSISYENDIKWISRSRREWVNQRQLAFTFNKNQVSGSSVTIKRDLPSSAAIKDKRRWITGITCPSHKSKELLKSRLENKSSRSIRCFKYQDLKSPIYSSVVLKNSGKRGREQTSLGLRDIMSLNNR